MPSDPAHARFELKYCERCGGLWLRPQGGAAIYCSACALLIRELPELRPPRRPPVSQSSPCEVIG